ncbi:MAG TPA: molybdenum cofactor biosynthesis protein MoaE [Pseudobdellovibrionaceae bacterium]|jgi:molybdopterin synthase catalytic subunit
MGRFNPMGKILVAMTESVLDVQKAIAHCRSEDCGAEILFIGTVRNINEGRAVSAVNYDGHKVLGEKILLELCLEAQAQWGDNMNFWVEHRLGVLKVGEESLLIHVTSPHRDSAYQASRYLIEQIKLRLPVWKEEIYWEGDTEWLKGQILNQI